MPVNESRCQTPVLAQSSSHLRNFTSKDFGLWLSDLRFFWFSFDSPDIGLSRGSFIVSATFDWVGLPSHRLLRNHQPNGVTMTVTSKAPESSDRPDDLDDLTTGCSSPQVIEFFAARDQMIADHHGYAQPFGHRQEIRIFLIGGSFYIRSPTLSKIGSTL